MKQMSLIIMTLVALVGCGSRTTTKSEKKNNTVVKQYSYEVVAEYPHSRDSYTQGLQYIDLQMWEGTGNYGKSKLQRIDLTTGKAEIVATLKKNEFGEGITVLGNKIYQLTWQNHLLHIYDRKTGTLIKNVTYNGEGWGLTSDGESLYMSDGSSTLRVLDTASLKVKRTIPVLLNGQSLDMLNELEWIEGKIWANVYTYEQIVIIDPRSGHVEGIVDLRGILPEAEYDEHTDVLNGIAYDDVEKRLFVTGKNWSKLFEIKIVEQ